MALSESRLDLLSSSIDSDDIAIRVNHDAILLLKPAPKFDQTLNSCVHVVGVFADLFADGSMNARFPRLRRECTVNCVKQLISDDRAGICLTA
jgi:hypothetical protein